MQEKEYVDLAEMMQNTRLFELDGRGDYHTWSNKHIEGCDLLQN